MAGIARLGQRARCQHARDCRRDRSLSSTALVSSSTNSGTPSARSTISSTISLGETGIAGEPLDQRRAVMAAEPVQRKHRHMRLAAPGVLELGAEGDDEQDGQPRYPIERQVEQLARGRVDPMRVLEDHQNRPAPRQSFELMQQCLEQHLALALRAEVELGGGIRQ